MSVCNKWWANLYHQFVTSSHESLHEQPKPDEFVSNDKRGMKIMHGRTNENYGKAWSSSDWNYSMIIQQKKYKLGSSQIDKKTNKIMAA